VNTANRHLIYVEGTDRVFHRLKVLIVLLIPLAMALMAISSINVAVPSIESGLGASESDIQWTLAGYALTFGISLIPAGRTGDVLGRGTLFIVGLAVFTAGSLLSGLAGSPIELNLARFLQGFGAGVYNPQTTGMIQQYFTGVGRAKAYSMFGLTVSVSVAIAPVLTGFLIGALGPETGWRISFLLNVPLGLIGIVLALVWFPFETERIRRRRRRERKAALAAGETVPPAKRIDLDPVGAVLIALTVLSIMFPFMAGAASWVWGLLPVGVLLLFAWLRWERWYTAHGREPMVNLALFRLPSFSYGTAIAGTLFLSSTSNFVIVAMFLQTGLGQSALTTALIGLPNAVASAVTAVWAGRHTMRIGRQIVVGSLVLIMTGIATVIVVIHLINTAGISVWWVALPFAVTGLGAGAFGSANQTLTMLDVPISEGGAAGGVKSTAERIGTAVGNTIITAVLFAAVDATGWITGTTTAFAAVIALVTIPLAIAIRDLHRAPRVIQPTID
jgi:MFS family permease